MQICANPFFAGWIKSNVNMTRNIIFVNVFWRWLSFLMFCFYQLSQVHKIRRSRIRRNRELYNTTDGIANDECSESMLFISPPITKCLEAFFILHIACIFVFEIGMWVGAKKLLTMTALLKSLTGEPRQLTIDSSVQFARLAGLVLALMILIEIDIYNSPTETKEIVFTWMRSGQASSAALSLVYHMEIFDSVGNMIVYFRRIFKTYLIFAFLCGCMFVVFGELFFLLSDAAVGGCTAEFSSFAFSVYSTCLVYLNVLDLRNVLPWSAVSPMLVIATVCLIFIVGILLFNLLISLFSDEVSNISANVDITLAVNRIFAAVSIDLFLRTITPKIILAAVRRMALKNHYVHEKNRIYIVARESARRKGK